MEILVFGAGSLGSLVGGLLAREHDVTLVGRESHMSAVRADGLVVEGEIETTVTPDTATSVPADASVDLAIVTVKSFDTQAATQSLTACSPDSVLSLQNGLGNEQTLSQRLDGVLAGTCTYGATYEPGRVRCTGVGEIVLGPPEGGRSDSAERVSRAFAAAGLKTTVDEAMSLRLWEKLAVNAGINATTALARVENGALREHPVSAVADAATRETAQAARTEGVELSDEQAVAALKRVVDATADNSSSMLQDVRARKRTEIDAINGYVAGYADTPVNTTLTRLLQTWEQKHDLR